MPHIRGYSILSSGSFISRAAQERLRRHAKNAKLRQRDAKIQYMDFLEVVEKRKSVRKYSDRPVEKELLDAINAVLAELLVEDANGKTEIEKMVMAHMGMN